MDGTVDEGILLYKGQEKKEGLKNGTLQYPQTRPFQECWEQGIISILFYVSKDKKSIDFLLWKDIGSVYCFFQKALIGQQFCYFSCLSQLVATL